MLNWVISPIKSGASILAETNIECLDVPWSYEAHTTPLTELVKYASLNTGGKLFHGLYGYWATP